MPLKPSIRWTNQNLFQVDKFFFPQTLGTRGSIPTWKPTVATSQTTHSGGSKQTTAFVGNSLLQIKSGKEKKHLSSTSLFLKKNIKLKFLVLFWKLCLLVSPTPKKKHGFPPPASGCLRTMPLNWRSASALGNVAGWFPKNPGCSQLPFEQWDKGPLDSAWTETTTQLYMWGCDNNPFTLPETFTVYSKCPWKLQ